MMVIRNMVPHFGIGRYLSVGFQHLVLPFHSSQRTVLQLNVNIPISSTGLGASCKDESFLFSFFILSVSSAVCSR